MWDSDGLKLSVGQYLHNMHRTDRGLWGNHPHPGDASAQDGEVPSDHPCEQPAGRRVKPETNPELCVMIMLKLILTHH